MKLKKGKAINTDSDNPLDVSYKVIRQEFEDFKQSVSEWEKQKREEAVKVVENLWEEHSLVGDHWEASPQGNYNNQENYFLRR